MPRVSWEQFEGIVKQAFADKTSVEVICTIGSRNILNDIDMLTFKTPKAASSSYLREIHEGMDYVQRELQKRGSRVIKYNRFSHEDCIEYIAKKLTKISLFI